MSRQDAIERIAEHLRTLDDEALASLLRLVERLRPEDDAWDRQIRADSAAGKLDKLLEQAKRDDREGRTTEL